jgi:mono/diheme cytochrome c family protein
MREAQRDNTAWVIIIAVAVAVGIVASTAGAAPKQTPEPGFVWKDGAEVYAKVCAFCHEAKVGPTIRGRGLDPAYVTFIVRHGNRAMPSFRAAEIDDESLAKVAEYVSKAAANQ